MRVLVWRRFSALVCLVERIREGERRRALQLQWERDEREVEETEAGGRKRDEREGEGSV